MSGCFFKQKTAYEMRISDWSSDVCSSDLRRVAALVGPVVDHTSRWLDRVRKSTLAIAGTGRETCGAAGKRSQLAFQLQACRFTFVDVLLVIEAGLETGIPAEEIVPVPGFVLPERSVKTSRHPVREIEEDRKSVGKGKSVSVRVDFGGRRLI